MFNRNNKLTKEDIKEYVELYVERCGGGIYIVHKLKNNKDLIVSNVVNKRWLDKLLDEHNNVIMIDETDKLGGLRLRNTYNVLDLVKKSDFVAEDNGDGTYTVFRCRENDKNKVLTREQYLDAVKKSEKPLVLSKILKDNWT